MTHDCATKEHRFKMIRRSDRHFPVTEKPISVFVYRRHHVDHFIDSPQELVDGVIMAHRLGEQLAESLPRERESVERLAFAEHELDGLLRVEHNRSRLDQVHFVCIR